MVHRNVRNYITSTPLLALSVRFGGIVSLVHDQILRPVILLSGQIALEDGPGACGISLLRIDGCTRHVRDHGVAAAKGVLGITQRVIFRCWLREPDVSTVASEMSTLQSLGNIFLDDNGAAGSVDQPRACVSR